jgi:hypothetical protein
MQYGILDGTFVGKLIKSGVYLKVMVANGYNPSDSGG